MFRSLVGSGSRPFSALLTQELWKLPDGSLRVRFVYNGDVYAAEGCDAAGCKLDQCARAANVANCE